MPQELKLYLKGVCREQIEIMKIVKSRLSVWPVIATLVMHSGKLNDVTEDRRLWATLSTRLASARRIILDLEELRGPTSFDSTVERVLDRIGVCTGYLRKSMCPIPYLKGGRDGGV